LEQDWVLLEPGVTVLAQLVPAEHRWITVSDGRVTVYAVCPPVAEQRCRVEHRLACAGLGRSCRICGGFPLVVDTLDTGSMKFQRSGVPVGDLQVLG
jgi:hypothetical protein